MSVIAEFRNLGYFNGYCYRREFEVFVEIEEGSHFYLITGRDTALAGVIEKYIIHEKFLWSGKRLLRKKITERQWHLLRVLQQAGPKYHWLYSKAINEKKSMRWLESQLVWRVL